ncbi:hypothetical protein DPP11_25295 [Salmonella enterica subsp. enterica]|nr:hypothetical protein [Salmonella enterica]ECC9414971.1 hypothetical protein [Salmonella enterica subsp. enterica]
MLKFNVKMVAASLYRQGRQVEVSPQFSPINYRGYNLPVSENLLKQNFYTSSLNQKWTGIITYLLISQGWLYLSVVIDLWSLAVIDRSLP